MALRAPFGYADRAAEQSAHGSLVQARTRLCLIFNLPADALCAVPGDNVNMNALLITPMLLCGEAVAIYEAKNQKNLLATGGNVHRSEEILVFPDMHLFNKKAGDHADADACHGARYKKEGQVIGHNVGG